MHFISQQNLPGGVQECEFAIGDIPGILWIPPAASPSAPVPLILMGQPGALGMRRSYPRMVPRAQNFAMHGFASVTIELPGAGDRAPLTGANQARANLVQAISAGVQPADDIIDQLILPLVDQGVPEWQATLDEVLALPETDPHVGFSGGVIAVGTRLASLDSRIEAASLFAGTSVPRTTIEEARRITIPLHFLLQWDDEHNDRERALELFDAYGSAEKALYANMGGHTGVPQFVSDDSVRFFARHLRHVMN
jgi:hypothetical protein